MTVYDRKWMVLKRTDDPRHPDYVMRLTDHHAVWLQDCNGYDAYLVELDPGAGTIVSRDQIARVLHVTAATVNHEPGYGPDVVCPAAVKYVLAHAERKTAKAEKEAAEWRAIRDALTHAGDKE